VAGGAAAANCYCYDYDYDSPVMIHSNSNSTAVVEVAVVALAMEIPSEGQMQHEQKAVPAGASKAEHSHSPYLLVAAAAAEVEVWRCCFLLWAQQGRKWGHRWDWGTSPGQTCHRHQSWFPEKKGKSECLIRLWLPRRALLVLGRSTLAHSRPLPHRSRGRCSGHPAPDFADRKEDSFSATL
jgi:hypothetical protein